MLSAEQERAALSLARDLRAFALKCCPDERVSEVNEFTWTFDVQGRLGHFFVTVEAVEDGVLERRR